MADSAQGPPPTGRQRRRAVGPSASATSTAGVPEPATRELGWGEADDGPNEDERLLREVPPHHGD